MKPRNSITQLAIGFFIGAFTIGTVVIVWNYDSRPSITTYGTSTPSMPVMTLDSAVKRVASQFVCSCGTCGEERLDVCSCETARQERAFIQNQLRDGHTESEAAEAVNHRYGGFKPSES